MNYQSFYLEVMKKLQGGLHLESEEAKLCVQGIFQEQLTEIQIAALLMRLSAKGESVSEVVGFVRGMRDYAVKLNHQTGKAGRYGRNGWGWIRNFQCLDGCRICHCGSRCPGSETWKSGDFRPVWQCRCPDPTWGQRRCPQGDPGRLSGGDGHYLSLCALFSSGHEKGGSGPEGIGCPNHL